MIRKEIAISVEIIRNVLKCLRLQNTKIFTFAIAAVFYNLVDILCINLLCCQMCTFYCTFFPQDEEVRSSSWRDKCTHLTAYPLRSLNILSVIMLLCQGNTSRKQDCKVIALSLVLLV